jgi:hypothetical protein
MSSDTDSSLESVQKINGFVNRGSAVQSRPPAPESSSTRGENGPKASPDRVARFRARVKEAEAVAAVAARLTVSLAPDVARVAAQRKLRALRKLPTQALYLRASLMLGAGK